MGCDPAALARVKARTDAEVQRSLDAKTTRKEKEIQAAILAYLALVPGVVAWRNNTGAMFGAHKGKRWAVRFGHPGLSDILGWKQEKFINLHAHGFTARFLALEVKRPQKHASPAQQAFLDAVRAAGGIAGVVRSVDDARRLLGL